MAEKLSHNYDDSSEDKPSGGETKSSRGSASVHLPKQVFAPSSHAERQELVPRVDRAEVVRSFLAERRRSEELFRESKEHEKEESDDDDEPEAKDTATSTDKKAETAPTPLDKLLEDVRVVKERMAGEAIERRPSVEALPAAVAPAVLHEQEIVLEDGEHELPVHDFSTAETPLRPETPSGPQTATGGGGEQPPRGPELPLGSGAEDQPEDRNAQNTRSAATGGSAPPAAVPLTGQPSSPSSPAFTPNTAPPPFYSPNTAPNGPFGYSPNTAPVTQVTPNALSPNVAPLAAPNMPHTAERRGEARGLLVGLVVGGVIEHIRHKRRERRMNRQLREQGKRTQELARNQTELEQRLAALRAESTKQKDEAVQRQIQVEQDRSRQFAESERSQMEAAQNERLRQSELFRGHTETPLRHSQSSEQVIGGGVSAERKRPALQPEQLAALAATPESGQAEIPEEPVEVPDGHRVEASTWHRIEIDKKTGKVAENPTLGYGEEFQEEQRREHARPDPLQALGAGTLGSAGTNTAQPQQASQDHDYLSGLLPPIPSGHQSSDLGKLPQSPLIDKQTIGSGQPDSVTIGLWAVFGVIVVAIIWLLFA